MNGLLKSSAVLALLFVAGTAGAARVGDAYMGDQDQISGITSISDMQYNATLHPAGGLSYATRSAVLPKGIEVEPSDGSAPLPSVYWLLGAALIAFATIGRRRTRR
jgi:hypothetical protein